MVMLKQIENNSGLAPGVEHDEITSLLDAVVDRCFPILEHYGDLAEDLEDQILERTRRTTLSEIHQLKRGLLLLRRAVWLLREVVSSLLREPHECVNEKQATTPLLAAILLPNFLGFNCPVCLCEAGVPATCSCGRSPADRPTSG